MSFRCPSSPKQNKISDFQIFRFPRIRFVQKTIRGFFLDYLRYPDVSTDTNNWFWGSGTRPKLIEVTVSGLSHEQIEQLLVQDETY